VMCTGVTCLVSGTKTSETVHLSANNIVQGASTNSTSKTFHTVING